MRAWIWATNVVVGGSISIYAAIGLLSGGSVQGVPFDFGMFVIGLLLLFNAKESWT